MEYERQIENVKECLSAADEFLKGSGITLLAESINLFERPSYLVPGIKSAAALIKEIGSTNVKLLYDIYHQSMHGDFDIDYMIKILDSIGHFHVADCPGRHEPGTGNVNYNEIFDALLKNGYDKYIGLEYISEKNDAESVHEIINMIGR